MIDVGKETAQARMMKQVKSVRDDILKAVGKVFNVNEHTVIIEAEYDVKTYELQRIGFSQMIELDAIAPINNFRFRAGFISWMNILVVSRITEAKE